MYQAMRSFRSDPDAVAGKRIDRALVRRVFRLARPYRRLLIGFLVTAIAASIVTAIPPLLFRSLLDTKIGEVNADIGKLQTDLTTANNNLASANAQISSLTGLLYASIGIAMVGVVVAIISVAMLMRRGGRGGGKGGGKSPEEMSGDSPEEL